MTSLVKSSYTREQTAAWLRGLLTLAWADGDFNETEQQLITSMMREELSATDELESLKQTITPEDLADALGTNTEVGENFLRTAVIVAIADGIYSICEAHLLSEFREALGLSVPVLETLQHTVYDHQSETTSTTSVTPPTQLQCDVLQSVRNWLERLEINNSDVAKFLCKMIPAQCPFEQEIKLFHKTIHIPPLCQLNPLYDQLVSLRFRALSYLAEECQEDVSKYC